MKNKKKLKCIKNCISSINVNYLKIMTRPYTEKDLEKFLSKIIVVLNQITCLIDDEYE